MLWKLLGLQRLLEELVDESWLRFDLPHADGWFHDDAALTSQD